jgi:hypothetical protein
MGFLTKILERGSISVLVGQLGPLEGFGSVPRTVCNRLSHCIGWSLPIQVPTAEERSSLTPVHSETLGLKIPVNIQCPK